jgi:isochorismate pyruvate lyase
MPSKHSLGKRKHCESMAEVRAEIDALDRQIVALLADRLHYIDEAARLKQNRDQVRDEARIADVLEKVEAEAQRLGTDATVIVRAYRALVESSIEHELVRFAALRSHVGTRE